MKPAAIGVIAFIVTFVFAWGPPARRHWEGTPLGLDSAAYINIAVQIARGNGLQQNELDPAMQALAEGGVTTLPPVPSASAYPSTRWPPLLPIVIAGTFRGWSYSLDAARTINCAVMALAAAFIAAFLAWRHGTGAALIFIVVFGLVDERIRSNARALMTEPLATCLISVGAMQLMVFARQPRFVLSLAAGVIIGLAVLARSAVFLWVPGLTILVAWLSWRCGGASWRKAAALAATFAATSILVCLPWFVHNSRALGAFMPLGSHIYTLPSGFSDEAWERGGVWYSLGEDFFSSVVSPADTGADSARKKAEYGRARAVEWMRAHPLKSVVLGFKKAFRIWVPNPSIEMMYLLFPLLGLLLVPEAESTVIAAFLLLNTLGVAATWTWEADRFQVPLLGLLHYAGALGIRSAFMRFPPTGTFWFKPS